MYTKRVSLCIRQATFFNRGSLEITLDKPFNIKNVLIYLGAKTGVYTSLASVSAGNISEWNEVFLVNVNEVCFNM